MYQNANSVTVWLGAEENGSGLAMDTIARIGHHYDSTTMRLEDAGKIVDSDIKGAA